jgi:hypothetical protein
MHVLVPRPSDQQLPLFFNIDKLLGEGHRNAPAEDILLVQFLLRKAGEAAVAVDTQRKEVMLNVAPTGQCDDETIAGIKAFQETMQQRIPGTIVDSKVSPARGYTYGRGVFTIVSLNRTLRSHFPARWPRLQDFPDCPLLLKAKVPLVL